MRHLLYIIGPYLPDRDLDVAKRAVALARERGWLPVCPSLDTPPETGAALLSRLDPELDAVAIIPGWLRGPYTVSEHALATSRGLRIYDNITGLLTPEEQARCPSYGEEALMGFLKDRKHTEDAIRDRFNERYIYGDDELIRFAEAFREWCQEQYGDEEVGA